MSHLSHTFFIFAGWTISSTIASAANPTDTSFTYFRSDLGVAASGAGPLPDRLDAPGALRWKVPVDSGHSTPVLCQGKIILTTYRDAAKELATVALDRETGQLIWRNVAPAQRIESVHRTGNPAASTPAFDGQRIYVFFGSHGLICYDLEGKKVWDHPLGPFQDEFGSSSSPVLVDDKVILQEDHDINSFVMAIDRSTGQTVWKTPRPDAVRSYSTPAVWTVNGRKQLLVAGALELAGYDPSNGEKLWWVNGLARIVIPIAVPAAETIYMASWSPGGDAGARISLEPWKAALEKYDKDKDGKLARAEVEDPQVLDRFFRMDLDQSVSLDQAEWERHAQVFRQAQNAMLALRPAGRGELTDRALLWKYHRGVPYVATPLAHRGSLWMVKDGGIVTRLDAGTGRVQHEERVPGIGSYYASPVTGDGKVYFASELGVLSVVADKPEWNVLSSHDFKEKIYATPVIERDRIYIRTEKALYCFQGKPARN
ncbi:MAG: PQQ-binding-like beta-propeller repeat protein [Verrucomicrobia bacterium]|nr:PQQ-binding-like beta-propeller repeat protein [Verrucomicrobiota bacterium]